MKRSEIFDSFIKIAQEKGMISNDSSEAKKKLEQTRRADSLDISAIEALYGVKPDAPKEFDYKSNIMEVAHPNSVVVSPAYDKLNGLVENNIERQNIMLNLVNKSPDGLLTNRKYAEQELMLSLVRIANDLDNQNKEPLRVLADNCLLHVNAEIKKEAWWIPAIAATVATLGAIYLHRHLPNAAQGIEGDYKRLSELISEVLSEKIEYGFGHEYDNSVKQQVEGLKAYIDDFMAKYRSLSGVIDQLEEPRTNKELIALAKSSTGKNVVAAYNELDALFTEISTYLDQVAENFQSDFYKQRHVSNTGLGTSILEKLRLQEGAGTSGLMADPLLNVATEIPAFKTSVLAVLDVLKKSKSIQEKAKTALSMARRKSPMSESPSKIRSTPSAKSENMADKMRSTFEKSLNVFKGKK